MMHHTQCDTSDHWLLLLTTQNWVEDLSGHVKSLDQNHLVLLGHSGVFGASTPDKCAHKRPCAPMHQISLSHAAHKSA